MGMITKDQVIAMMETIFDPEIGVDIWSMGLIYSVDILDETSIHFLMTYTSPLCPAGPQLHQEIRDNMITLGFKNIAIDVTFDPPWKPSQVLKDALGLP